MIRCPLSAVCCLLIAVSLCAVPLLAQGVPDPFTSARVHVGPFAVNPSVAVTDVGVDTNVFNSWDDPQGDWTATVKAGADTWLRLGRARLNVKLGASYVYFAEFDTERAWNTDDGVRLEVPMTHLRPWLGATYLNVKERPGYEIDVRARRTETGASAGVDLLLSRKTTFTVSARKLRTDFPSDATFADTYLAEVLNRDLTAGSAGLRYALTPLTTLTLTGDIERERFEFSPERDSNGYRVVPGVEFDPFALISGTARVGYRNLKMLTAGMPDYSGPVASVDLAYRLLGVTRFAVTVKRDVEYSYDLFEPYYVQTGVSASVTQSVGGPWALEARYGTQRLSYRRFLLAEVIDGPFLPGTVTSAAGTTAAGQGFPGLSVVEGSPALVESGFSRVSLLGVVARSASPVSRAANIVPGSDQGRTDKVVFYGGGISYKLGPSTRLGFNVDYYTRRSDRELRQYEGLRAGTSVTYGF